MVANLNICGFLYSGADIGGFGDNCNEELKWRENLMKEVC
jgi:alpha-glucosidase (family GH31 glycosyl hydrolase)